MNRTRQWWTFLPALLLLAGCGGGKPEGPGKGAGPAGPPAYGAAIVGALASDMRRRYRRVAALRRQAEEAAARGAGARSRAETLDFEIGELSKAGLTPGEEEGLAAELALQRNAAKVREALLAADDALSSSEHSTLSSTAFALARLREAAAVDPRLSGAAERLRSFREEVQELSRDLASLAGKATEDPEHRERAEARLSEIRRLKRKYGKDAAELVSHLGEPRSERDALHKYSAGKVLTIAGSGSLPGAAVLTATSALKIGAGASILCYPKSVRELVHKKLGEVVVKAYEDNGKEFLSEKNLDELTEKSKWADVVAIGPGLGREKKTQSAVISFLKKFHSKKVVIEADAVFALGNGRYKKLNLKNCVLTPHHAEFVALIGISNSELKKDILMFGNAFVEVTGSYVVLKGAPTIIFTPEGDALINTTGNPALAKFGTGDVLTGFIAGLLAQQNDIEKAIVTAVYLHSLAADILAEKRTKLDILATDIQNHIPQTIKFLVNSVV